MGPEQQSFQAVIDGFTEQNPDVDVKYNPVGDELPTVLSTAVEGGNPPDLAAPAQPGFVQGLVDDGALKPISFAEARSERTLATPAWPSERSAATCTASSTRPRASRLSGTTSTRTRKRRRASRDLG